MSNSSEELLIERRLRAAEIALETARRRRFETDEAVRALQAQVARAETELAAALAGRDEARRVAEGLVQEARGAQRAAEQRLVSERRRRQGLEDELAEMRESVRRDGAIGRQLAAEARVRELEGERELVLRRAAEFEYGVRMAAFDALKLVRDLAGRVSGLLPVSLPALPGLTSGEPVLEPSEPAAATSAGAPATASAAAPATAPGTGSDRSQGGSSEPEAEAVDSHRLDAALDRLRANVPPPDDAA